MNIRVAPAVVVLSQNSVTVGRKIANVLAGAKLYGLANRTHDVDISFTNFGETLRELFAAGTPIIGICAAGILIRTIAPILTDKGQEPPILAVAEDGSAVVPLLGGLSGVNDLARHIGSALNIKSAITTTGDIRFHTALLSPPSGYYLANPEHGKKFIADLLAGGKVKLEGTAPWLSQSNLPIDENGELIIQITENLGNYDSNCLVYHPAKIAIALTNPEPETITQIQQILAASSLAPAAVAGIFAPLHLANNFQLHAIGTRQGATRQAGQRTARQ